MAKQQRSVAVMRAVTDAVIERLWSGDETMIRIPEVCAATGVNYGSVYHHFGSREGVIDAAYTELFRRAVGEDLAVLRRAAAEARAPRDFLNVVRTLGGCTPSADAAGHSRAMRARVVAAALVRPELRASVGAAIGATTDELAEILATAQHRGLLRPDRAPRVLAAVLETLIFGRVLEDLSDAPVESSEWDQAIEDLLTGAEAGAAASYA